jgi:hypothetical protein
LRHVKSRNAPGRAGATSGAPRTLPAVPFDELLASLHYWALRLGAFVVLNVLDDPAWLALIFC